MIGDLAPTVTASPGMGGWQVQSPHPIAGAEHQATVKLRCNSTAGRHLTSAGVVAILSVFSTYLTAGKVAAIQRRAGEGKPTGVCVTRDEAWCDVLPEDQATLIASLVTQFQLAANVTA